MTKHSPQIIFQDEFTRADLARAWEEGFQRAEETRTRRKRSDLKNPYGKPPGAPRDRPPKQARS